MASHWSFAAATPRPSVSPARCAVPGRARGAVGAATPRDAGGGGRWSGRHPGGGWRAAGHPEGLRGGGARAVAAEAYEGDTSEGAGGGADLGIGAGRDDLGEIGCSMMLEGL